MTLILETQNRRAHSRPQVLPRRREFLPQLELTMIRLIAGSERCKASIVFAEKDRT
jgi:hypothetical protein